MYDYAKERPTVFTEEGVRNILKLSKVARVAIEKSGAISNNKLMAALSGNSFHMMACIDFLEECGEITCATKVGIRNEWIYF